MHAVQGSEYSFAQALQDARDTILVIHHVLDCGLKFWQQSKKLSLFFGAQIVVIQYLALKIFKECEGIFHQRYFAVILHCRKRYPLGLLSLFHLKIYRAPLAPCDPIFRYSGRAVHPIYPTILRRQSWGSNSFLRFF